MCTIKAFMSNGEYYTQYLITTHVEYLMVYLYVQGHSFEKV